MMLSMRRMRQTLVHGGGAQQGAVKNFVTVDVRNAAPGTLQGETITRTPGNEGGEQKVGTVVPGTIQGGTITRTPGMKVMREENRRRGDRGAGSPFRVGPLLGHLG
jgi:hypothetical protein